MKHIFENEWVVEGYKPGNYIDCKRLYNWIKINNIKPEYINFEDIAKKPFCGYSEKRCDNADINVPGIVSTLENPYGKKYRLIDGRHRIKKASNKKINQLAFFIIPKEIATKFIEC